jgi:hypothetical protein
MWALLLIPAFFYLAILFLLYAFQTRLLFPTSAVGGAGPLPPGAERLTLATPDGETLHGVHLPPHAPGPQPPLLLGFSGNAWNAEDAAAYLHDLYPEAEVVAFHYRGYRPSTGTPSAEALIEDAPLAYDLAVERVRPRRVVAVGFSIGSGVAASLSGKRPLAGLILVTPFDSLKAVAASHYRWLPVRFLFRHEMDSAKRLRGSEGPVAILAGERDTLVPPARTEALRRAVGSPAYDRTITGAGHNDLYDRPLFRSAMREALETILADRRDGALSRGGPD